jgi:hypothetical protein
VTAGREAENRSTAGREANVFANTAVEGVVLQIDTLAAAARLAARAAVPAAAAVAAVALDVDTQAPPQPVRPLGQHTPLEQGESVGQQAPLQQALAVAQQV